MMMTTTDSNCEHKRCWCRRLLLPMSKSQQELIQFQSCSQPLLHQIWYFLLVLLDHLRCDINITLYWAYSPNLLSTSFWSPLEFEQSYINFISTVGVAEKVVVAVRRFPCEHSLIHSFSFSFSSSYNFIENKSLRVENRFSQFFMVPTKIISCNLQMKTNTRVIVLIYIQI